MNTIYDNGEMLLGSVGNVLEYARRQIEGHLIDKEDYEEIINTLRDLDCDTIVAINYDNGMGMSFDWWTKDDELESYLF